MARVQAEAVAITFSKLVKGTDPDQPIITADILTALEQVAEELAGTGIVVEVTEFETSAS
jgi:hypothetical protein